MLPEHLRERMANASPQFHGNEEATNLVVDADSLIYIVAATTKTLETAKRRFVSEAMTLQFLADATTTELHLTPKHCKKAGRFNVTATKEYQGNRDKSQAPTLVEPLRYAIGREQLQLPPEFSVIFNDVYEADDSVVMRCTADPKAIYYSQDKDLDCLRNRKLCQTELKVLPAINGLGWICLKQMSGSKKLIGRGPLFFWAQMLMGDQADNIAGVTKAHGKLCGAVATLKHLKPLLEQSSDDFSPMSCLATTTEQDIARLVLELYRGNNQNFWPEAWLLWLYRTETYSFGAHMKELGMLHSQGDLSSWVNEQARLPWFIKDTVNES